MNSETRAHLVEIAETVIYNLESDDSETAFPWAVELVEGLRKVETERVGRELTPPTYTTPEGFITWE